MDDFKQGDKVICRQAHGYPALHEGNTYEVIAYEPVFHDYNFTWPAYLHVKLDEERKAICHAYRFELAN